ncbi:YkyA family protein [Cerasibacillus terrae]|nr:YkyA family protein [Cerasibacillus terrae]
MYNKRIYLFLLISLMMLLTACGGSVEEKIHGQLEEVVSLEKEFEQQQSDLAELEKKEQAIYKKIIDLPLDELDKIKKLSNDAKKTIETRLEKINLEQESLHSSKEEFEKVENVKKKLEDDSLKKTADKMYKKMMDRYDTYDQFHKEYTASLKLEKELYDILSKENSTQDQLSDQLEKLNDSYKQLIEMNDEFNKKTKEYNDLKKKFYEEADLNVSYK